MEKSNREQFLKQLGLLAAAGLLQPKSLFAEDPAIKVQDFSIIDLHCHPSLKMYLWGEDMRHRHCPGSGDNYIEQQIDIRTLQPGYVRGMMATHYLVEASAKTQWTKLEWLFELVQNDFPRLEDKLEHEDFSNFTQINIMIDTLEDKLHLANQYLNNEMFVVARNYRQFEKAISEGKIPFAHAIEGAHALGRHKPLGQRKRTGYQPIAGKMRANDHDVSRYIENLEALKARGVCMITLGHLFENDVAYPCEGIAVNEKAGLGMNWHFDPDKNNFPLKPFVGPAVVEKMLEIGMIVDLTHTTPATCEEIFAMNNNKRPLTFTHVGSREMFNRYDQQYNGGANKNFGYYSVSQKEIEAICKTDGVIGVTFENFWLTGCNTHLSAAEKTKFHQSIPYVVEAMVDINQQTPKGDFSNIAIGSDFDGFADQCSDLYIPSQLSTLVDAMKNPDKYNVPKDKQHEFTDEEIRMVFYKNAQRLLEKGWT